MLRVLVTGANGHLGANIVRILLRRGDTVIPFVRRSSDLRGLERLGLDCCYGDVMDASSLTWAVEHCDAIIHTAAVYKTWSTHAEEEIVRPAMQGAQNIFPAAGRAGVSRMVYISSMAAIGYSRRPDELRTEACWDEDSHNPYHHSKTCSEQEAMRLSEECGVPTVRICPTFILGPYDFRLTPSSGWIQGFVNWTSPTWRGGLNFVDVRDVAQVCVDALETGQPGQRFIVGGDNLEIRQVGRFVKKLTGVTPFHLGVPTPLAFAGGALMDFASIFTHKPPLFSRDLAHDYYGRYGFFDCSLARRTFGLNPRPGEAVIRDCIRWLLFIGKIKPAVAKRLYESLPPDPEWCEDSGPEYAPQFERLSRSARWN